MDHLRIRPIQIGAILAAATLIVGTFVTNATAEEAEAWMKQGEETVTFKAGGFLAIFNSEARVNASGSGGSGIDLEGEFGLDANASSVYASATWRIAPRHRLDLGYFAFDRDATRSAQRNIEIGNGNIIAAGATTNTSFKFDVYPFSYRYSFHKTPKHELAAGLGVFWYDVNISIAASAFVAGGGASGQVNADASLPLPFVGLSYDYYINDRWSIGANAEYFQLDLSDQLGWKGYLYHVGANVQYWVWNNVGLGAQVSAFGIDADVDKSDWNGSFNFDYWGPQIYLTGRF